MNLEIILIFLEKSSSAAGRTKRRLGNTSTCPQCDDILVQQLFYALKICCRLIGKHSRQTVICNFIEIALGLGCSPLNLLRIFRTPFERKSMEGYICTMIVFYVSFALRLLKKNLESQKLEKMLNIEHFKETPLSWKIYRMEKFQMVYGFADWETEKMIYKAHSKGKFYKESHFVSKIKEERSRVTSGSNITDTSANRKKKKKKKKNKNKPKKKKKKKKKN